MVNKVVCNKCEKKCMISIDRCDNDIVIEGSECDKGVEHSKAAISDSSDIFTTIVRIKGADYNVVPVKSTKPIDKSLWIECSKALSRLYVGAPIGIGDIICKNLLNTGVDIVCTKNVDKSV